MILTVNVENTIMEIAAFDKNERLVFESKISTSPHKMCDEYAIMLSDILKLNACEKRSIEGAMIASVVPTVTEQFKRGIRKLCGCEPMCVSPGIKTGLNIKIDDPASLGADLAAVAVGTKKLYPLPAIIINLGTATKLLAVDKTGCFRGGIIAPGVKISAEALSVKTASLPLIGLLEEPLPHVIGTNTIECMRSGLLYGTACMLDGLICKFEEEIGEPCTIVATGSFSSVVQPLCKREFIMNPILVHIGLYDMYQRNR